VQYLQSVSLSTPLSAEFLKLSVHRYKPDVQLRFITEELGFESDADAAQFIVDHNGQHLLEDRKEFIAFLTGKAGSLFEGPKAAAFSKVDIKGQI